MLAAPQPAPELTESTEAENNDLNWLELEFLKDYWKTVSAQRAQQAR